MAEVTAQLVKQLREETSVSMIDCKKALTETEGDLEKAKEYLRKKGLAKGDKMAARQAAEGLVDSYIHTGGRVGVLVEVNCETDFVARGDTFRTLVHDIAIQIAACPNVEYVSVADIPEDLKEREKGIEMGREDLNKKPEKIREQIVQGRIEKLLKERTLLDQPFVKDQTITIDELIRQTISKVGENIKVRRFSRFTLGEGLKNA
ncbi:translation elongation factor Ts [Anthocerotibacter panamensis]|uniref:translation elongation factor Ts n=1 Tax=Anthocerotibacter panamensis TaxID=2857077 RepID=UPI001C40248D|nr:translation elongation factor Ts [Anthocerotibacter panamensis]